MMNADIETRRILAVLGSRDEAFALGRILEPEIWKIRFEPRFPAAEAALLSGSFPIVICEVCFDGGHYWTEVLESIRRAQPAPLLIVADRLADEALWAEVLNLGGYDVLMTPFERDEVIRIVTQAWRAGTGATEKVGPVTAAVSKTAFP